MPAEPEPRHSPAARADDRRRGLVLRPGAIGDTLLTLPALAALRRHWPDLELVVAGNPTALPVVAPTGSIDRWLSFDDARVTRLFRPGIPAPDDAFGDLGAAVAWCGDPDGVLDRALAARGAEVVAIRPSRPPADEPVHVARYLLETLAPLGLSVHGPLTWPPIDPPAAAMTAALDELADVGLADRPFVVVQPGSGSAAKNWPPERFAAVLDHVHRAHGLAGLVLGGPADRESVARLRASAGRPYPVLWDRPLLEVAALLGRATVYLGNDSGLSHLAGLLGVRAIVLFGPTDPTLWRPLGPRVRVIRRQPLEGLSPDEVLGALVELIGSAG